MTGLLRRSIRKTWVDPPIDLESVLHLLQSVILMIYLLGLAPRPLVCYCPVYLSVVGALTNRVWLIFVWLKLCAFLRKKVLRTARVFRDLLNISSPGCSPLGTVWTCYARVRSTVWPRLWFTVM